jgi:alkyl hydroperoxide reductase subunit AhpF
MALISPSDQQKLRESFAEMTRPVRLLFFTQTLGCDTCLQTRQILDELPPLSDRITIEEVNLILEPDRAKTYGVDRAPAVAIAYQDGSQDPAAPEIVWQDSRIRFLGAPSGYEFMSLVQAVLLAGGRGSRLSADSLKLIAAVNQRVTMQVFTTPT